MKYVPAILGVVAVAIACYVTKSGWPLFAFILVWDLMPEAEHKNDQEVN